MRRQMSRLFRSPLLREIIRPLIQMAIFIAGSGTILSAFMLLLAWLMRGTTADSALLARSHVSLFTFTLVNLPQVLVDAVTLGFMYAAIALGYSMVYGVLEFINFAHSEIFATGAFVGVELLIYLDNAGRLKNAGAAAAIVYLILAIILGMIVAGLLAMGVERVAYRPLRGAPSASSKASPPASSIASCRPSAVSTIRSPSPGQRLPVRASSLACRSSRCS
jgi:branched-chain amino acid transport system permease protein